MDIDVHGSELFVPLNDVRSIQPIDLIDAPEMIVGLRDFPPGADFANHIHSFFDETLVGLVGELSVWCDRAEPVRVKPGDTLTVRRGTQHFIRNETGSLTRIAVIKAPGIQNDTEWIEWIPA